MRLCNEKLTQLVFEEITKDKKVKGFLEDLKEHHEKTYLHSIKVSFLCIDIGISKGFNEEDLVLIGIAGLFHDIGKLLILPEILSKKKFNENDMHFFSMCPRYAFVTLKDTGFDQVSKIVIAYSEFQKSKQYPRTGIDRRAVKRLGSKERRQRDHKVEHLAQIVALADLSECIEFKEEKKPKKKEYSTTEIDNHFKFEFLGESKYISQILERI